MSWRVVPGSGTLSAASSTTDSAGLAAVRWTVGSTPLTRGDTVTASANSLPSVTFIASAIAEVPGYLTIVSGNFQTGVVMQPLASPLTVSLTDSIGRPVAGARVTWSTNVANYVPAYGQAITPATALTDTGGLARATWTMGYVAGDGVYGASASASHPASTREIWPVWFSVTALPGPPTQLFKVSGDSQTAAPGQWLPTLVGVRPADEYGNTLMNATVNWSVTAGGGSVDPHSAVPDWTGVATTRWTLGRSAGPGADSLIATTGSSAPAIFMANATGLIRWQGIAAGGQHTCAVATTGEGYCWGDNSSGQLGNGSFTATATPLPVALGKPFLAVTLGDSHSCGLVSEGWGPQAYCWGANSSGQLEVGDRFAHAAPTLVSGSWYSLTTLSAGGGFTCEVTAYDDAAECAGDNTGGELGTGDTVSRLLPTATATFIPGFGNVQFNALVTGRAHACGLSGPSYYCWGANASGQLGLGDTATRTVPTFRNQSPSFAELAAGGDHTCALTAAGAAYCWGRNAAGELGDGTTAARLLPVPVTGDLTFTSLAAGRDHTCGLTASGAAYCWGGNTYGQVGDGSISNRSTPVPVAGGLTFAALAAGDSHTCGVTPTGAAYCWGRNAQGQLGDGTTVDRWAPAALHSP